VPRSVTRPSFADTVIAALSSFGSAASSYMRSLTMSSFIDIDGSFRSETSTHVFERQSGHASGGSATTTP